MSRIAIKDLKELAKKRGLETIIVFATDGELQHVATYGDTIMNCDKAALWGDNLKRVLHWPQSLLNQEPSRVKKLKAEIERLKHQSNIQRFMIDTMQNTDIQDMWACCNCILNKEELHKFCEQGDYDCYKAWFKYAENQLEKGK